MRFLIISFGLLFLVACKGGEERKSIDITVEEIDEYIDQKIQPTEVYDIIPGMRFSKSIDGSDEAFESYEVTSYEQNDSVFLYTEEEISPDQQINRSIYFKEDVPILVEEYTISYSEGIDKPFKERRVYMNGAEVLKAEERSAAYEDELDSVKFSSFTAMVEDYDYQRPSDAVQQTGDYDMKFGEFLILPQAQYLVCENEKSGYNVALVILQDDELLNDMFTDPDKYQGKSILLSHQKMVLNNVEQMVYEGGTVRD